jgi:hypothetical protein
VDFPFTPKVRGRKVAESIRAYGTSLFRQIFADPQARDQYRQATQQGLHSIQLEIAGSVAFHRLHWEALHDPELDLPLALQAPIIRQNRVSQVFPSAMQPSKTINILVVVARPGGSRDVGYRTISRPLVEELARMKQPINVTLLRPGTYQALDAHGCGTSFCKPCYLLFIWFLNSLAFSRAVSSPSDAALSGSNVTPKTERSTRRR